MPDQALVHVIDDDDAVRDSLEFLLGAEDFAVRTYDSASAFLEQLAVTEPGCVITDVRMPDLSGIDLLKRFGELGIALPVIVITAHGDVPLAVEAMRLGAIDFLEKPFDDRVLVASVRTALQQRQGDRRTPEGLYKIDYRNARSSFHLALHISYPDTKDRAAARKAGVSPGGAIMIHGIKNGMGWLGAFHSLVDWTDGCIAVSDQEIEEIWRAVPDGTPIEIRP